LISLQYCSTTVWQSALSVYCVLFSVFCFVCLLCFMLCCLLCCLSIGLSVYLIVFLLRYLVLVLAVCCVVCLLCCLYVIFSACCVGCLLCCLSVCVCVKSLEGKVIFMSHSIQFKIILYMQILFNRNCHKFHQHTKHYKYRGAGNSITYTAGPAF
jgi:hypothetical protein